MSCLFLFLCGASSATWKNVKRRWCECVRLTGSSTLNSSHRFVDLLLALTWQFRYGTRWFWYERPQSNGRLFWVRSPVSRSSTRTAIDLTFFVDDARLTNSGYTYSS